MMKKLHQIFHVTVIHVIKVLIFANHSPDKCVSLGAAAGVDGPARGDDCLLVPHHDMTCFRWLSHIMHDKGIFWHIKVQIDFHTSVMRVARHRVPYTSRF